ncbi:AAA family ATPase [Spiroplasma endosymbiont of Dioctria linearis]|uniref:AAA family ATPase n=1 Tax=Spiroplasma endosymbiont of Dioctria linearis TaxID=3066290 RepID=UPI00313B6203
MNLNIENICLFQNKNKLEISDLTLICGMNDSGKSTLNKTIYMMIKIQKEYREYSLQSIIARAVKKLTNYYLDLIESNNISQKFNKIFEKFEKEITDKKFLDKIDYFKFKENIEEDNLISNITKLILESNFIKSNDDSSLSEIYETINLYVEIIDDCLDEIINKSFEERLSFRIIDRINLILRELKWNLKIIKKNNLKMKNIKISFLNERIKSYIESLFGSNYEIMSKFNDSKISKISMNLFNNKIDILINKNSIKVEEIEIKNRIINDVTYCEGIANNFINNMFLRPLEFREVSVNDYSTNYSLDFYQKVKESLVNRYRYNDEELEENINNLEASEKEKIEKIIMNIFNKIGFENEYDKKSRSYKKKGKFINEKNVSKGILTFQSLIKILRAGIFKENSFVILDEAENFLHPNMQNEFIKILLLICKETKCKIILTTHSPFIVDSIEFESEKFGIKTSFNYLKSESEFCSKINNFSDSFEITNYLSEMYKRYE